MDRVLITITACVREERWVNAILHVVVHVIDAMALHVHVRLVIRNCWLQPLLLFLHFITEFSVSNYIIFIIAF